MLKSEDRVTGVMPNMLHPIVRKFYHNKPAPQMLDKKMNVITQESKPSIQNELKVRARAQEPVPAPAQGPPDSRHLISSNPSPRLRENSINSHYSLPRSLRSPTVASQFAICDTLVDAKGTERGSNNNHAHRMEARLQQLEHKVLNLKNDNEQKDKEIRKLRIENERLRGKDKGYEMGAKRRRF